ncbi:MAG: EF-hand domain-containing protein [Verrucomicrobia bacterium]|nr:EF-hand domain-containing protein [Verrucomicrobiota bacterium]
MKSPLRLAILTACLSFPLAVLAADKPKPKSPFAAADVNGDGKISAEEYTTASKGQLDATAARAKFAALDTNKDGSLSRGEFAAGQAKKAPRKKKDMPSN